jgi:hypothetical protein
LPAKQGLIRDFIDVVLEASWPPPLPRSLRCSYRRLAYLADGQQLAEDPLGKKARGQLLALGCGENGAQLRPQMG